MECKLCNKKKGPDLKVFVCDGCNDCVCTKCSKLTASEIKVLELKTGRIMKYLCPKCLQSDTFTLLHQTIEDKNTIIESKEEIITLLRAKIKELEGNTKIPLYSTVTSMVTQNKQTVNIGRNQSYNNVPNLMIIPKQTQDADVTKRDLQRSIKPSELKVGIKSTRTIKNGGMILKCHDKHDIEKLKNEAEDKLQGYEVRLTQMRRPRIKIIGYEGKLDAESLEQCIREQNSIFSDQDYFKVTYIKTNKRDNTRIIYSEVSPQLFHKVMSIKKLFIHWERCPVYEDLSIQRCFNCQQHYHKNSKCTSAKVVCERCAEEHTLEECPKIKKECINCKTANDKYGLKYDVAHTASDPACPSYAYLIQVLRSKIDYGGYDG